MAFEEAQSPQQPTPTEMLSVHIDNWFADAEDQGVDRASAMFLAAMGKEVAKRLDAEVTPIRYVYLTEQLISEMVADQLHSDLPNSTNLDHLLAGHIEATFKMADRFREQSTAFAMAFGDLFSRRVSKARLEVDRAQHRSGTRLTAPKQPS